MAIPVKEFSCTSFLPGTSPQSGPHQLQIQFLGQDGTLYELVDIAPHQAMALYIYLGRSIENMYNLGQQSFPQIVLNDLQRDHPGVVQDIHNLYPSSKGK